MSNRYIGGVVTETTNVAQSPWSGSWTEQAAMQGFNSVLKITNSLRFRASANAYLNRTPSVAGNQKTWTWSGWVKRGTLGATQRVLDTINTGDGSLFVLSFNSSDQLAVVQQTAGVGDFNVTTTQVFRDPSAWYYIDVAVDTTQATAANRIQIYVNGSQLTSFATANYPSQNSSTYVNSTKQHYIGCYADIYARDGYFDGYLAEVNFIDGQALPPTAFGAINKETGVWAPIAYAGTYGLNGFHLDFKNATSTTTLGYDTSGNGNNWTTNNISLTAGSTYDWMIDSPSKIQGTGYGVGNYCVISPLSGTSGSAVTNGNLTVTGSSSSGDSRYGSIGVSSGKWYWEHTVTNVGTSGILAGISSDNNQTTALTGVLGYYINGNKYSGSTASAYGASFTTGDVIGVAFDADAGTLTFYKNNVSQGVAFTGITGTYYPLSRGSNSGTATVSDHNFGQRPFAYTPPTGYKTLCTQNLPVATIYNGASYMAATTYTGNGSTQSIVNTVNGVSFQPDLVWGKSRSNAYQNILVDVIRGASTYLQSSTTAAEATNSSVISAFTSTGFTVGSDATLNGSGTTDVAWQWKAGGTAVTNTAGSITSSVSANTTSGFSVVTFTAQTSGTGTVGHGLGVAPSMIITKSRNNISGWPVYHISTGNTGYLNLTTTGAFVTDSTVWNNTSPTTSVFQSGSVWAGLTQNIVAYCFAAIAGYSAFGSYTGNGSSDGPFVYCGFRPRYILFKCSSTADAWDVIDTARDPYNGAYHELFPNLSDAEYSGGRYTDILSNGFKLRTSAYSNVNGQTYIYAAFAENPFSVALAR